MTREQIIKECKRVKEALRKTESPQLKRDYEKYLRYLQKRLMYTNE